ncbi:MAG TPA: TonB-dependent receptor [Kofleriaceae bacterium]|nr:TonB-dependent receptor [Kofleriaceae bacterium]
MGLLLSIPALAHAAPSSPEAATEATSSSPAETPAGVPGEIIVVTATRDEAPLAAAPITTEVIDRKRLAESGVQTVSEALALRPGLWLDRGVAGTTGITIQGLGPQYSLILVDGARQIGRTDGYLDLDRFGLADVEQIEIVRGPSSALYGADALGGVVNIITRRPADGLALDALSQLDDRLGTDSRGRLAFGAGGLAGALSGEYRQGPAIRRGGDAAVATTLDGHDSRNVHGRATDERGAHWRLDASADYLYQKLQGVDALATGAVADRENLDESASAQASAQYTGEATAVHVTADASLFRDQYLYDQRRSSALDAYQVTDERLLEGSAQVARQLGDHRVLVGGEALREALDSDRLAAPGARVRGAVYAQDEWRLTSALIVVPALRFDDDSQFGSHVTPRLAARWQVADGLAVRGSVGAGYRAPGFKELLLHFENPSVGYVVDGNPDLAPETSRSAQAGAEWQVTPWLWLSLSGYYNGLRDLITTVSEPDDGAGTLRFGYGNVGRARTAGLESFAVVSHGRAGLELGAALTRARDLDGDRALEGVPMQRFTATARWRDAGHGVDAFAAFVVTGHRPFYLSDDPQQATRTGRRYELRARIARRFAGGLGGFVGVDNAFDAGDANLDRLPPRTLYAGVELHR